MTVVSYDGPRCHMTVVSAHARQEWRGAVVAANKSTSSGTHFNFHPTLKITKFSTLSFPPHLLRGVSAEVLLLGTALAHLGLSPRARAPTPKLC